MSEGRNHDDLPSIPNKRYFTIGEVGVLCDLKPHVLRYWEQEFPTLKPIKRRGNRRYYQRQDVLLVRQICHLLYNQGYTISGARQKLSQPLAPSPTNTATLSKQDLIKELRQELEGLLQILKEDDD